ncbi:unnamed protein product [Camellia sinensis]
MGYGMDHSDCRRGRTLLRDIELKRRARLCRWRLFEAPPPTVIIFIRALVRRWRPMKDMRRRANSYGKWRPMKDIRRKANSYGKFI